VDNPVSQYSRGIVFWGAPLEDKIAGNEEEEKEAEKKEDDEIKE